VHRSMTDAEGRFVASTIFEQKCKNSNGSLPFYIVPMRNPVLWKMHLEKEIFRIAFMVVYLLSRKEIKDVLCYLRLVINQKMKKLWCVSSIIRLVNGDTTVEKLTIAANHYKRSIWEVMQNIDKIDLKLNSGTKQKLQDFVTMIQSFQVIDQNQDAFYITDHVAKKTGFKN
jgi:DNA helicase-2/ATP-dependent DNA helicase PcrA